MPWFVRSNCLNFVQERHGQLHRSAMEWNKVSVCLNLVNSLWVSYLCSNFTISYRFCRSLLSLFFILMGILTSTVIIGLWIGDHSVLSLVVLWSWFWSGNRSAWIGWGLNHTWGSSGGDDTACLTEGDIWIVGFLIGWRLILLIASGSDVAAGSTGGWRWYIAVVGVLICHVWSMERDGDCGNMRETVKTAKSESRNQWISKSCTV